jgi:hypothetical protein
VESNLAIWRECGGNVAAATYSYTKKKDPNTYCVWPRAWRWPYLAFCIESLTNVWALKMPLSTASYISATLQLYRPRSVPCRSVSNGTNQLGTLLDALLSRSRSACTVEMCNVNLRSQR